MSNIILGSGIVGNLASDILGGDWVVLPFKKSRYYSFDIPFADNSIVFNKQIDQYMTKFTNKQPIIIKKPLSYMGQLVYNDDGLRDKYLKKVYGDVSKLNQELFKTTSSVYQLSVQSLLSVLDEKNKVTRDLNIKKYGDVLNIDVKNRLINCKGGSIEFDKIVNTIPLNSFIDLCGLNHDLVSKPVYFYFIECNHDMEGADDIFVADDEIDFFRVSFIRKNCLLFWSSVHIENPIFYFGKFLSFNIDILDVRVIKDAIPLGQIPDLNGFESNKIFCVGSNSQWDDNIDVSTCINRLLRFNNG